MSRAAAKKTATKKAAPAKKAASTESVPNAKKEQDLATSGRDTAMVAEDQKPSKKVSDLRQAQADRATGGGGQGVASALLSEPSHALNPAFYPQPE
jgi:hypothetical protein